MDIPRYFVPGIFVLVRSECEGVFLYDRPPGNSGVRTAYRFP